MVATWSNMVGARASLAAIVQHADARHTVGEFDAAPSLPWSVQPRVADCLPMTVFRPGDAAELRTVPAWLAVHANSDRDASTSNL